MPPPIVVYGPKSAVGIIFGWVQSATTATVEATTTVASTTFDVVADPVGSTSEAVEATAEVSKSVASKTVDVVSNPVGSATTAVDTTVDLTKTVASTTAAVAKTAAEVTLDVGAGAINDTVAVGTTAVELSTSALESTFELLGVSAAFQSVFGADVDKSDEGLEKAFAKVDADSSGKISSDEMKAYIVKVYGKSLDEALVDKMMAAADANGDGEVDLGEFKKIMRAGPDE